MICNNCGEQIRDAAKFCRYCGKDLTNEEEVVDIENKRNVRNPKKSGQTWAKKNIAIIVGVSFAAFIIIIIPAIMLLFNNNSSNTKTGKSVKEVNNDKSINEMKTGSVGIVFDSDNYREDIFNEITVYIDGKQIDTYNVTDNINIDNIKVGRRKYKIVAGKVYDEGHIEIKEDEKANITYPMFTSSLGTCMRSLHIINEAIDDNDKSKTEYADAMGAFYEIIRESQICKSQFDLYVQTGVNTGNIQILIDKLTECVELNKAALNEADNYKCRTDDIRQIKNGIRKWNELRMTAYLAVISAYYSGNYANLNIGIEAANMQDKDMRETLVNTMSKYITKLNKSISDYNNNVDECGIGQKRDYVEEIDENEFE